MTLEQYKRNNKLTYKQLSIQLDIPLSTVHKICTGGYCVSLRVAAAIVQKTDGKVWWTDLLDSLNC